MSDGPGSVDIELKMTLKISMKECRVQIAIALTIAPLIYLVCQEAYKTEPGVPAHSLIQLGPDQVQNIQ